MIGVFRLQAWSPHLWRLPSWRYRNLGREPWKL